MPGGRPKLGVRTIQLRREIGGRLRNARENAALTLEDVAGAVGMCPRRLGEIELGERPIPGEWLPDLARAVGVTGAHLLGEQRSVLETAA